MLHCSKGNSESASNLSVHAVECAPYLTDFLSKIISHDDCLPMYVEKENERDSVLDTVWLQVDERNRLTEYALHFISSTPILIDIHTGRHCQSTSRGRKVSTCAAKMYALSFCMHTTLTISS
jgi:hypothetical protein